jgi:hypothetical protein
VQAGLDGLKVTPSLPPAWKNAAPLQARFYFRGQAYELTVDPAAREPHHWTLTEL